MPTAFCVSPPAHPDLLPVQLAHGLLDAGEELLELLSGKIQERAIQSLEPAAARSSHAAPKYHLAMAYIKVGDLNRARRLFSAAQKINPQAAEAKLAHDLLAERTGGAM